MIDPQAIQSLLELGDSESLYFVKELEEIFEEQTPKLIQKMNDGVKAEDMKMVFSGAHTLKASCAYLGIGDMLSLCEKIEAWSQQRVPSQNDGIILLQSLDKNYSVAKDELHKIIAELNSEPKH